jgi:hypothetical protein
VFEVGWGDFDFFIRVDFVNITFRGSVSEGFFTDRIDTGF